MIKQIKKFTTGLLALLLFLAATTPALAVADEANLLTIENDPLDELSILWLEPADAAAELQILARWEEQDYALPPFLSLVNYGDTLTLYSQPDSQDAFCSWEVAPDSQWFMLTPYVTPLWHEVMCNGQVGYISTAYVDATAYSDAYKFSRDQDMRVRTGYTGAQLEVYLRDGMSGLGEVYADAERLYGVNALFMIAICRIESVNGNSALATSYNNLAGISGGNGWARFSSKSECVYYLAEMLSARYLSPQGNCYHGSGISGVSVSYCGGSGTWITNVGNAMQWCWEAILEAEAETEEAAA